MSVFIYAKNRPDINLVCHHLTTPRLTRFDGDRFYHRNSPVDLHKEDIVLMWPSQGGANFPLDESELDSGAQVITAQTHKTTHVPRLSAGQLFRGVNVNYLDGHAGSKQWLPYLPSIDKSFVSNFLSPSQGAVHCFRVYDFEEEYRVLSFFGTPVVCGKKVPINPVEGNYHPSIRSHKLGWGLQWGNVLNKDAELKLTNVVGSIAKRFSKNGIVAVDFGRITGLVDEFGPNIIITKMTSYEPVPNALAGKLYASKIKRWAATIKGTEIPEVITTFNFDDAQIEDAPPLRVERPRPNFVVNAAAPQNWFDPRVLVQEAHLREAAQNMANAQDRAIENDLFNGPVAAPQVANWEPLRVPNNPPPMRFDEEAVRRWQAAIAPPVRNGRYNQNGQRIED